MAERTDAVSLRPIGRSESSITALQSTMRQSISPASDSRKHAPREAQLELLVQECSRHESQSRAAVREGLHLLQRQRCRLRGADLADLVHGQAGAGALSVEPAAAPVLVGLLHLQAAAVDRSSAHGHRENERPSGSTVWWNRSERHRDAFGIA